MQLQDDQEVYRVPTHASYHMVYYGIWLTVAHPWYGMVWYGMVWHVKFVKEL